MTLILARPDRVLPGAAMLAGSCIFAPLIDVAARLAVQRVSVTQVTRLRMAVQGALMVGVVRLLGQTCTGPRG